MLLSLSLPSLQNDYKTLDPTFMESVWWVFKQLYDKGLVYRGFKVGQGRRRPEQAGWLTGVAAAGRDCCSMLASSAWASLPA